MQRKKPDTLRPWQRRRRLAELRDMAISQLFYKHGDFDLNKTRNELSDCDPGTKEAPVPSYLETEIALILAFESKPRRAQKSLYRLYKARAAQLQLDRFESFVSMIKRAGEHGVSLEGIYFPQAFHLTDHAPIWADVGRMIARVQNEFGTVFLNSGTLLGVVRDKALIAHDDDVDLALILKAASPEEAAEEWRQTEEQLGEKGMLSARQGPNPGVVKLSSEGFYNIDLFPAWIADGKVYVYPHTSGELAEREVLPLSTCETSGLPIPAKPEAMLALNYGAGWREPDPGFEFPWGRANRRFAAFREALSV